MPDEISRIPEFFLPWPGGTISRSSRPGGAVVYDSVRDSGWPLGQVGEPSERFAALFRSQRAAILACYAKRLEALRSPVIADPRVSGQAMAHASQILADV
jgi:hypothetical protein